MSYATCHLPGCLERIAADKLMCFAHWKLVPGPLQKAVYSTWNLFRREHSFQAAAAHRTAKERAIEAVQLRQEAGV